MGGQDFLPDSPDAGGNGPADWATLRCLMEILAEFRRQEMEVRSFCRDMMRDQLACEAEVLNSHLGLSYLGTCDPLWAESCDTSE